MEPTTYEPQAEESMADKVSHWIVLVTLFLVPFFFIPSAVVPFQFGKTFIIYIGIIAAFCAWVIARLKEGRVQIPWSKMFLSLGLIAVPPLVSVLFSPTKGLSLIGQGFEIGTASFIVAMVILSFLTSFLFSSKKNAAYAYLAILASFAILLVYHLIRLFVGPNVLSFGIFSSQTASPVGTWNDFGIFFGAVALFSFITLELLDLPRRVRWLVGAVLVLSFFFLSVINFSMIWYVLGIFALIFFIYNFSFNKARVGTIGSDTASGTALGKTSLPIVSLVVVIVSFVFIIANANIYSTLSSEPFNIGFLNKLAVSNVEIRPSWQSTVTTAKEAFKSAPIFGVGPNRFSDQWLISRPLDINATSFWGIDFQYGVGYVPTLIITTGILGLLSWIIFFAFFLMSGFRALFARIADPFAGYLTIASFVIALYLWIFAIFAVPSAALIMLTFFFTGMFGASLIGNRLIAVKDFHFVRDPRTSFVSVLVFIILLLSLLTATYAILRRFISAVYYNTALVASATTGNIETAEINLIRANQLNESDVYERALANLNLIKINLLVSQQNISQDILQSQFAQYLRTALAAAEAAVAYDPTNYQNYVARAKVYEAVVPLKTEGAYDKALADYTKARELNPKNPALPLLVAQLEVANGNTAKAKESIDQALQLKSNYTEAIYLLSQIQVAEGDLKSAIQSVQAAALISPNDPGVFFQLGLLRYNDKNYSGAADAFEQAVRLVPEYANAKYFLGLSYEQLNRTQDAIQQFEDVKALNPGNAEIDTILSNIRAGRDPFANLATTPPERRSQPPVQEPQGE